MKTDDSGMSCPFCKTSMVAGYIAMQGCRGGIVYFSTEKTSSASWLVGLVGTLGKEKETVLSDYPADYSRPAYKCGSCNAVVLEGKPSSTEDESVQAEEAEKEARRDNEDLSDRARQMAGI